MAESARVQSPHTAVIIVKLAVCEENEHPVLIPVYVALHSGYRLVAGKYDIKAD